MNINVTLLITVQNVFQIPYCHILQSMSRNTVVVASSSDFSWPAAALPWPALSCQTSRGCTRAGPAANYVSCLG